MIMVTSQGDTEEGKKLRTTALNFIILKLTLCTFLKCNDLFACFSAVLP